MGGSNESTALLQRGIVGHLETPHKRPVEINTESRHSRRVSHYNFVAIAAVIQSIRATFIHAILSLTPIPASLSLLTQGCIFVVIPCLTMILSKVNPFDISKKTTVLLITRGILSGIMMACNLFALENISVGSAMTLFAIAPSFASILSFYFLKDRISPMEALFLFVNMVGVYLVASPTISEDSGDNLNGKQISSFFGSMCAIITALLMATNFTLVKAMGSNVHYSLNVISIGIGCILCFFVIMDRDILIKMWTYPIGFSCLVGISVLNVTVQYLLNFAMQSCRPGPALVVRSFNVPVSFLLGYLFLNESPTIIEGIGVVLVLISIICIGTRRYS